jgi:secondary thiamine-phosphate synthase enzyme
MRTGLAADYQGHVSNLPRGRTSEAMGGVRIASAVIEIETTSRVELLDITDRIQAFVRQCGITDGMVLVSSLHSTCSVFVNEFQGALMTDIGTFLERVAPRGVDWSHNNPECSDCDRRNADAHLRALLLGFSVVAQVGGGALVLGRWQRIILAELDGARNRHVSVQGWDIVPACLGEGAA